MAEDKGSATWVLGARQEPESGDRREEETTEGALSPSDQAAGIQRGKSVDRRWGGARAARSRANANERTNERTNPRRVRLVHLYAVVRCESRIASFLLAGPRRPSPRFIVPLAFRFAPPLVDPRFPAASRRLPPWLQPDFFCLSHVDGPNRGHGQSRSTNYFRQTFPYLGFSLKKKEKTSFFCSFKPRQDCPWLYVYVRPKTEKSLDAKNRTTMDVSMLRYGCIVDVYYISFLKFIFEKKLF